MTRRSTQSVLIRSQRIFLTEVSHLSSWEVSEERLKAGDAVQTTELRPTINLVHSFRGLRAYPSDTFELRARICEVSSPVDNNYLLDPQSTLIPAGKFSQGTLY